MPYGIGFPTGVSTAAASESWLSSLWSSFKGFAEGAGLSTDSFGSAIGSAAALYLKKDAADDAAKAAKKALTLSAESEANNQIGDAAPIMASSGGGYAMPAPSAPIPWLMIGVAGVAVLLLMRRGR